MDTHRPGSDSGIEKHGDVAVTYQPFRMTLIGLSRDAVQQMDGAISAPGAYNGLDIVIIESPEQVGSPFVGCSSIDVYVQAVGVRADGRLQSPTSDYFCGLDKGVFWHPVGGRNKRNLVSLF